jgi:hypothetical protein
MDTISLCTSETLVYALNDYPRLHAQLIEKPQVGRAQEIISQLNMK